MKSSKWKFYLASLMATATAAFFPNLVEAQTSQTNSVCVFEARPYIPPETLATMAYRGAFKKEGIPGYAVLETEFSAGNITAEKIVQAAVTGCILSNKYGVAGHDDYVNEVKTQLRLLIRADDD